MSGTAKRLAEAANRIMKESADNIKEASQTTNDILDAIEKAYKKGGIRGVIKGDEQVSDTTVYEVLQDMKPLFGYDMDYAVKRIKKFLKPQDYAKYVKESVEQELDENAAFVVGINALAQKIAPHLSLGVRRAIVIAILGGVALPFVMDILAHETNKIRDEARLLYDYLKKEFKKMKGQKPDTGTTQKPLESPKAANTTDLTKRKFKGESVEQIAEAFKSGDTVKVPHKGKMVRGRIIRYDDGGTGKARQSGGGYVVDVGEPASIFVPDHKVVKEEVEQIEEAYYSKAGATPLFVPAKFVYDEFFAKVRESGMMFNRLKAESALEYIYALMHNPKSPYSKYQGMDILHASALEHYRKIMGLRKEEVEVAEESKPNPSTNSSKPNKKKPSGLSDEQRERIRKALEKIKGKTGPSYFGGEEWKSLKKTKVDLDALRKQGYKVSVQHGEGDTLYRVSKTKSNKPVKKEDSEQIDELNDKTKASYVTKRGSQLQRMTTGLDHYRNLLTGRQQANAVKGIKRAMGMKKEDNDVEEAVGTKQQLDADFKRIADIIRQDIKNINDKIMFAQRTIDIEKNNPRFNRDAFIHASGLSNHFKK
jgi:hypothetical protein